MRIAAVLIGTALGVTARQLGLALVPAWLLGLLIALASAICLGELVRRARSRP